MRTLRWFNPFRIRRVVREIRKVSGGGGPARLRLVGVHNPRGIILPTSKFLLEVEARDGTVHEFAPELPIPWPYAWAYRVSRLLKVPLVSSVDPSRLRFGVSVPGRRGVRNGA